MTRLQHALQHAGDPPVVTVGTSDHSVPVAGSGAGSRRSPARLALGFGLGTAIIYRAGLKPAGRRAAS